MLVTVNGLVALAFPLFVGPVFRRVVDSMGAAPPSRLIGILQGWGPAAFGLLPLGMVAYALLAAQSLGRRRVVLLLAFVLTVVESVFFLVAMYASLFTAMGTVQ